MRVSMYYSNHDIRVEEKPIPSIGAGELLVKVESSGICGSDVMEWYRKYKVPLVLGHEMAGEIAEIGTGVNGFSKGDRIVASHHVPCGTCHYCTQGHPTVCNTLRQTNFIPGAFSEYLKLTSVHVQQGVLKIPDTVSYDEATFVEPLACVLRGQKIARMNKGKTVLILGSGISGLLHVSAARALGAEHVIATDVIEYRLNAARRFGATEIVSAADDVPERIKKCNKGRLADIVIVCAAPLSVYEQALQSVDRGGTILVFSAAQEGSSLPVPINDVFWRNEITITSSYAGSPADCAEALKWIVNKKINVSQMITHRFPLDETNKGFELVSKGKESIKVIIKPHVKSS
ncbi:MAG: zinc-dependent dehydrogenase [bacterium]